MTLKRKQIRAAITQLLINKTSAGERVYNGRMYPVVEMPLINIFVTDEEADKQNTGYHKSHRVKKGNVEIWAMLEASTPEDDIADMLDDFCEQITGLLDVDYHLGGLCTVFEYDHTKLMFAPEAEIPHAIASINYEIQYKEN